MRYTKYPWVILAIFSVWLFGVAVIIFRPDAAAEYLYGLILFTTVLLIAVGFHL